MAEPTPGAGAGRLVAAGVGLYLLAILVARLVIAGGMGWVLLSAVALVLVVVLASRIGLGFASAALGSVAAAALAFRWLILSGIGWPVLLLLPVVAVTAAIAGRVLAAMRMDRRTKSGVAGEGAEPNAGSDGEPTTAHGQDSV